MYIPVTTNKYMMIMQINIIGADTVREICYVILNWFFVHDYFSSAYFRRRISKQPSGRMANPF